jgi:hypothetical protein
MDGITCDICGKSLLVDEAVRYVADVSVYAAYDTMEITTEDLKGRDIGEEIRKTLESIKKRSQREIDEEVFANRRFDLCPPCKRKFLDELPGEAQQEKQK